MTTSSNCQTCGAGNRAEARFCRSCGTVLVRDAEPRRTSLPSPRRHRTTVLTAGISGLGALSVLGLMVGFALVRSDSQQLAMAPEMPPPTATAIEPTGNIEPAPPRPTEVPMAADAPAPRPTTIIAPSTDVPESDVSAPTTRATDVPVAGRGASETGTDAPPATEPPPPASHPEDEATREPVRIPGTSIELPRVSEAEEVAIGRSVADEVEAEYGLDETGGGHELVSRIGRRIVPHSGRPSLDYTFAVLDTDEVNAFAVPGGFIYVTRGMLSFVRSDDELAAVIGHEIAHVSRRHGAQQIEASAAIELGKQIVFDRNPELEDVYRSNEGSIASLVAVALLGTGWSRQQELEADEYGTIYMTRAGYPPRALVRLFEHMDAAFEPGRPGIGEKLLRTHPPFEDRIARVEETIASHGLE